MAPKTACEASSIEDDTASFPNLQLSHLRDEELIRLSQETPGDGYSMPSVALWLRHREWIGGLIGRLSRQRGLLASDADDAGQDAAIGFLTATARYDLDRVLQGNGCTFRTFLYRVLTDRFNDFVKQLRRSQSRLRLSSQTLLDGKDSADGGGRGGTRDDIQGQEEDPAVVAEWNELSIKLRAARQELDETEGRLLDEMLAGEGLRKAAGRLGLSYDATKRRWRKVRSYLTRRLGASNVEIERDCPPRVFSKVG